MELHVVLSIGAVFGILCGITLWWGLFYGCEVNTVLRLVSLVSIGLGVNLTFIPIHLLGLHGTPRRYSDYPELLYLWNSSCSIGGITSFTGMIVYLHLVFTSLLSLNRTVIWSNICSSEYSVHRPNITYTCTSSACIIGSITHIWYWRRLMRRYEATFRS